MSSIPISVQNLINKPGTVKALVTSSKDGKPHAIVAGSISCPSPDTVVFARVLSKVSVENLEVNPQATFLISNGMESYDIDCKLKAKLVKGPEIDNMNKILAGMKLKTDALFVFDVLSVYNQSAGPDAGTKME